MKLPKLFRRKEHPDAVGEAQGLLNGRKKEQINQVVQSFMQQHLARTEGVIIIWATEGEVFGDMGGLSEAEVLGCLDIIAHRVQHEGIAE